MTFNPYSFSVEISRQARLRTSCGLNPRAGASPVWTTIQVIENASNCNYGESLADLAEDLKFWEGGEIL